MFGAVIFDDSQRPGSGWASVRGKEAFRVRGTGDLASDIFWWTNLKMEVFNQFGLASARLKRTDYLRPRMDQLHTELGLLAFRMPAARVVEITSEIFDRVLRLAGEHYGLEKPVSGTLAEDLYPELVQEDRSITQDIDKALENSYQSWASCEGNNPHGSSMVTFRRPRIQHALDVLATPVPGEQWEFVDDAALPPQNKRLDWLVTQARPALVKASVKSIDHEVAQIVAFGSGGGGAPKLRAWLSHPELLALSKFAKLKIEAAFLGTEYAPHPVRRTLATGGVFGTLSISMGILAENYWQSLANPRAYKRFSKEKVYSPRAVWYAASDRFYMMLPALMLHGSNFAVRGYGKGTVILAVQRGALNEARACAAAAGLSAPLHIGEDIAVQTALAS